MKSAATKSPPGSEFDNFLFATLGDDQNGLPLSVVSLLARLNLDPWHEAQALAALSTEAAAKRLALSLDSLMGQTLRQENSEAAVLRLLALLPPRASKAIDTTVASLGAMAATAPGARIGVIVFITSAIFLVGSQIVAAHRESSMLPHLVPDPVTSTVPSHAQPATPVH
jgi:hypothetical protein